MNNREKTAQEAEKSAIDSKKSGFEKTAASKQCNKRKQQRNSSKNSSLRARNKKIKVAETYHQTPMTVPRSQNIAGKWLDSQDWRRVDGEGNSIGDAELCREQASVLYWHVYYCTLQNREARAGWVAIPHDNFRMKFCPLVDIYAMVDAGLFRIWHYDRDNHRCNRLAIPDDSLEILLEAQLEGLQAEEPVIDAISGEPIPVVKSVLYDENRNKFNQDLTDRIRSYGKCLINLKRGYRCVNDQKSKMSSAKEQMKEIKQSEGKSPDYYYARQKYVKEKYKFKQMLSSMTAIQACKPLPVGDGIYIYTPPYKPQEGGRITHIGGGAQNAPRELQAALFADIPNYRNYDLVSAQPRMAFILLQEVGIEAKWLEEYLSDRDNKHKYSAEIEMGVDGFKACLNGILMATQIRCPSTISNTFTKKIVDERKPKKEKDDLGVLVETCWEESCDENGKPSIERATALYQNFYKKAEPLIKDLKNWHEYLFRKWLPVNTKISKRGKFVENAVGCKMYFEEEINGKTEKMHLTKLKSKLVAHLLQGKEAKYMTELCRKSLESDAGFKMRNDYHDGALIEGEVTEEVQRQVALLSGCPGATLAEKPFKNIYREIEQKELESGYKLHTREFAPGLDDATVQYYKKRDLEKINEEERLHYEELEQLAKEFNIKY